MLFHRHNYEKMDSIETKSEIEQLHAIGKVPTTWNSFKKTYITILKCSACGKIKTIKVRA
jgi:hypothetical protein